MARARLVEYLILESYNVGPFFLSLNEIEENWLRKDCHIFQTMIRFGQIIATSHDLTPKGR